MSQALSQVIVSAIAARREAKIDLLTNGKTRDIAVEQGKIKGWTDLLEFIDGEFHDSEISPAFYDIIEDNGDEPAEISNLTAEALAVLADDKKALIEDERWTRVLEKINTKIEEMKNFLMFEASKTRSLDVCQGKYNAMIIYQGVFEAIDDEVENRERERVRLEKERKSSLDFNGPAGEPGYSSAELEGTGLEPSEENEAEEGDETETTSNVVAFEQVL